jgi:hypothetical protein
MIEAWVSDGSTDFSGPADPAKRRMRSVRVEASLRGRGGDDSRHESGIRRPDCRRHRGLPPRSQTLRSSASSAGQSDAVCSCAPHTRDPCGRCAHQSLIDCLLRHSLNYSDAPVAGGADHRQHAALEVSGVCVGGRGELSVKTPC